MHSFEAFYMDLPTTTLEFCLKWYINIPTSCEFDTTSSKKIITHETCGDADIKFIQLQTLMLHVSSKNIITAGDATLLDSSGVNTNHKAVLYRGHNRFHPNGLGHCSQTWRFPSKIWLVVWNMTFIVPYIWECHHPN